MKECFALGMLVLFGFAFVARLACAQEAQATAADPVILVDE